MNVLRAVPGAIPPARGRQLKELVRIVVLDGIQRSLLHRAKVRVPIAVQGSTRRLQLAHLMTCVRVVHKVDIDHKWEASKLAIAMNVVREGGLTRLNRLARALARTAVRESTLLLLWQYRRLLAQIVDLGNTTIIWVARVRVSAMDALKVKHLPRMGLRI